MMAVDASAVLAIVLKEPDAALFESRILAAGGGVISPVNYWEVLVRSWAEFGESGHSAAEFVLSQLGVDVVGTTAEDARSAAKAFERFGQRGGGRLNLGDCFAYALAARTDDGLLFKGEDFPRTDVKSALA